MRGDFQQRIHDAREVLTRRKEVLIDPDLGRVLSAAIIDDIMHNLPRARVPE